MLEFEIPLEDVKPVPARQSHWWNRWIYCQHCRRMSEMKVLGRDGAGRAVFECGSYGCGKAVALFMMRERG